jgi:hypothetical protein
MQASTPSWFESKSAGLKCLSREINNEIVHNDSHAQYYLRLQSLDTKEHFLLLACMRSLGVTVASFSSCNGLTVLAKPSVATALRQLQHVASIELRPRRHKLHPALRRPLRSSPPSFTPIKLYAVLYAAPDGSHPCDDERSTHAAELSAALLRAGAAAGARAVSGCKLAVEVPAAAAGGDVRAAVDWLAARPSVG